MAKSKTAGASTSSRPSSAQSSARAAPAKAAKSSSDVAPGAASLPLGFDSLPALLSFGLACVLLLAAPSFLSGFWPTTYDYQPQATFLSITACVCLLMALRSKLAPVDAAFDAPAARFFSPVAALLALFFVWCALSVTTAVYRHDALLEIGRVGGAVAWFFIVRALLREERGNRSTRLCALLGALVVGTLLVCAPAAWDWLSTRNANQFGGFYNQNLFANFCAMALPLTLAWGLLAMRAARKQPVAASGAPLPFVFLGAAFVLPAAMIALGLLSTSSKGGFLAGLIGLATFALAVWRAKSATVGRVLRSRGPVIAIVSIVLLLAGGAVVRKTVLPRIEAARTTQNHSTMFRLYTWRGTLRMAAARPIFGWGPGSFPSAYPQFAITGYTRSAHQSWLQIAAENGFPALVLLLGACLAAGLRGWSALRGPDWPIAAASLGALAAFATHGLTDAGWSILCIALLLLVVLALLDTCEIAAPQARSSIGAPFGSNRKSSIGWSWLAASLVVALCASGTQRAVQGEDALAEGDRLWRSGAPSSAVDKAREAVQSDPLSGRLWLNLAQMQASLDPQSPEIMPALQGAQQVQPTRAANWLNAAKWQARQNYKAQAGPLFDRAVSLEPNETAPRLARARWRLEHKDVRAWKDLEFIARLADEPYGKYPATPEFVNLDFARAYVPLAGRALQEGRRDEARRFIERGLADVARAQAYRPAQEAMAREGASNAGPAADLNLLETQLKQLKEQAR